MRKVNLVYYVITILLMVVISGCNKNEIDISANSTSDNNPKTTQDAVDKYMNEILPDMYLEGDSFFSVHRISDEISAEDSTTVFIQFICEWISSTGEVVSGGASLISITFDKIDDALVYKSKEIFDGQEISTSSEITQKVKDAYSSNTWFFEMQTELEEKKYLQ